MIFLDELFTLDVFELCSEILFEVNSQGWNCLGGILWMKLSRPGFSLSGLELFRIELAERNYLRKLFDYNNLA